MTATTRTAGQELAAELRRYFHIGPRTRRYVTRNGCRADLHEEMLAAIQTATVYPGCYSEAFDAILRRGWAAYLSYQKHVNGYRINGALRFRITSLSPWHFAALLGRMVDAGIQNTGQGERFFTEMAARDVSGD